MNDFVVVGTDTNAGKTTFCLLFLTAFPSEFEYWKPVETGDSDSETIMRLVPNARVHPPYARFQEPVAPPLAAERAGQPMPEIRTIATATPATEKPILIETFGSPYSPFTREQLQIELFKLWRRPLWLVASSQLGAIGRTLQSLEAIRIEGLEVAKIILVGTKDEFAEAQIQRHASGVSVYSLVPPREWTPAGLQESAAEQVETLRQIRTGSEKTNPPDATQQLLRQDRQAVWHPYTSLLDPVEPLPVVAARDEYLVLADGRKIIDAISSWWTILHGHCHPVLMQAIQNATRRLDHVLFAGVTHPEAAELAKLMLQSSPWPDGRVFFSDNGSTAVEIALKLAYQYWCHRGDTQRTLFVAFDDCYHGDTFAPMALSRDPVFFGRFEPYLFRAARVPVSADALDHFLQQHAHEVAAVIIEPLVQGAGGMKMHMPAELKQIYEVAKQHGVLFIADEVMTANRTGTIWAFEQAGIAPDLICAAKTITGGVLPLAATLVAPHIVAEFNSPDRTKTFFHGHSFTANPLACAVAVANWKLLQMGTWRSDVARIERYWRENLTDLKQHPAVRDVRICGTIVAVELYDSGGYLAPIGPRIRQRAIESGVLLRPLGNVVYAMPPLCTSLASLARIAEAMRAACELMPESA